MIVFQNKLRETIGDLNIEESTCITSHLKNYLQYYSLDHSNCTYHNGYIHVKNDKVFVQIFKPQESRGTVYLLHGYFDHLGYLSPIVAHLIKLNYTVVGYDKIGHGLSTGKRAHIDSFNTYVETLTEVLQQTKKYVPQPFNIIGHSTGGATITDYMFDVNEKSFEKVILLAPLVRPFSWHSTVISTKLLSSYLKEIPRKFRNSSENARFSHFRKNDPLQPKKIPLTWVKAMIAWNRKIKMEPPASRSISIIQGKRDTVVSWKYNCRFLCTLFPDSTVYYLEKGKHHIAVENEESKSAVLKIITEILLED
jgi:alpha-beta hydrolase superfamily lysophospholipase